MKVFISEQMLLDDYEVSVNCENLICTIYSKCDVCVCVCGCVCVGGMYVWMYVRVFVHLTCLNCTHNETSNSM